MDGFCFQPPTELTDFRFSEAEKPEEVFSIKYSNEIEVDEEFIENLPPNSTLRIFLLSQKNPSSFEHEDIPNFKDYYLTNYYNNYQENYNNEFKQEENYNYYNYQEDKSFESENYQENNNNEFKQEENYNYCEYTNNEENFFSNEVITSKEQKEKNSNDFNETQSSISLLIPEVLAEIFAYLIPESLVYVRRVCKKWNDIARMESLCKFVAYYSDGVIPKKIPEPFSSWNQVLIAKGKARLSWTRCGGIRWTQSRQLPKPYRGLKLLKIGEEKKLVAFNNSENEEAIFLDPETLSEVKLASIVVQNITSNGKYIAASSQRVLVVWNSKFEVLFTYDIGDFARDFNIYGSFLVLRTSSTFFVWNIPLETLILKLHEVINCYIVHDNMLYAGTISHLRSYELNNGEEIKLDQFISYPSELVLYKDEVWCRAGFKSHIWNITKKERVLEVTGTGTFGISDNHIFVQENSAVDVYSRKTREKVAILKRSGAIHSVDENKVVTLQDGSLRFFKMNFPQKAYKKELGTVWNISNLNLVNPTNEIVLTTFGHPTFVLTDDVFYSLNSEGKIEVRTTQIRNALYF